MKKFYKTQFCYATGITLKDEYGEMSLHQSSNILKLSQSFTLKQLMHVKNFKHSFHIDLAAFTEFHNLRKGIYEKNN